MAVESLEARMRRLLVMVPYVLRKGGAPVEEICSVFGITTHTLAQDINLLFLCGRPGYGPGDLIEADMDGGWVDIRMAEYFAKPLHLTPSEGLILYAGAQALAASGEGGEALDRALSKLRAALGEDVVGRIAVGITGADALPLLREARSGGKRVRIVYQSHSKGELTERDVDPWVLFVSGGRWYLAGYCHLVAEDRIFRVDRMQSVTLLDIAAEVPEGLDPNRFTADYREGPDAQKVVLEIEEDLVHWITDYYPVEELTEAPGGRKRVVLSAGGTAWVKHLLLRLGSAARVVEPLSLADAVNDLACRLLERYLAPAP